MGSGVPPEDVRGARLPRAPIARASRARTPPCPSLLWRPCHTSVVADANEISLTAITAAAAAASASTIGTGVTKALVTAARSVSEFLRNRFRQNRDAEGLKALDRVPDSPTEQRHLEALAVAVDRHANDPAFLDELRKLVTEWQQFAQPLQVARQNAEGSGNIQIANVSGSIIGSPSWQRDELPRHPG